MSKKIITLIIFLSIFSLFPSPTHAIQQTGGTNYVIYDIGSDTLSPTLKKESNSSLKSVIGNFNEHPDIVGGQLVSKCAVGQRKISLMVWYFPFLEEWGMTQDAVYIQDNLPMVNSRGGSLSPKHLQNLKDVVALIANLKSSNGTNCFNELQFRFAPMGIANPLGWTSWDEDRYQENKQFIFNTRQTIRSITANLPITIYFDLAAENGGQTNGQNIPYLKKIWHDYVLAFGTNDTYGFSIAWAPGRFANLINIYDQVGTRPTQHAIDLYDEAGQGMLPQLQALQIELQQTNELATPLLIQETYFDDQIAFDQITSAANNLGLNIRTIMQWQMQRAHLDEWIIWPAYRYFGTSDPLESIIPSDLNNDGSVNIFDYNLLLQGFGDKYDIFDYNQLVQNYGK